MGGDAFGKKWFVHVSKYIQVDTYTHTCKYLFVDPHPMGMEIR